MVLRARARRRRESAGGGAQRRRGGFAARQEEGRAQGSGEGPVGVVRGSAFESAGRRALARRVRAAPRRAESAPLCFSTTTTTKDDERRRRQKTTAYVRRTIWRVSVRFAGAARGADARVVVGSARGWRTVAKLAARRVGGRVTLGLFAPGTHAATCRRARGVARALGRALLRGVRLVQVQRAAHVRPSRARTAGARKFRRDLGRGACACAWAVWVGGRRRAG